MIRDEFKNDTKEQTKQKLKKEKQKKVESRDYYAKKIAKINDLFAPVKFSTIFCLVCFLLGGGIYILTLIVAPESSIGWFGWACIVLMGLLIIWTIVWFAILVPHLKNKLAEYKQTLADYNAQYIQRYTRR